MQPGELKIPTLTIPIPGASALTRADTIILAVMHEQGGSTGAAIAIARTIINAADELAADRTYVRMQHLVRAFASLPKLSDGNAIAPEIQRVIAEISYAGGKSRVVVQGWITMGPIQRWHVTDGRVSVPIVPRKDDDYTVTLTLA